MSVVFTIMIPGIVWGGFIFFLILALKFEKKKRIQQD